jgi:hypothetical protein
VTPNRNVCAIIASRFSFSPSVIRQLKKDFSGHYVNVTTRGLARDGGTTLR